jgi:hypothetical protein
VEFLASGFWDDAGSSRALAPIAVKPFHPNLTALPAAQRTLWPQLTAIPRNFVLYGGTAIALRLAHRQSVDFDFFTNEPFAPDELVRRAPLLANAIRLQSEANTLTVSVGTVEPVKLSFFGGLTLQRVGEPEVADDNHLPVASLLDLAATKMATVQQRAESKDYLDIAALLRHGIELPVALGAAVAVYGTSFNPAITLKALAYFTDGDLPALPEDVKAFLTTQAIRVGRLPTVHPLSVSLNG